MERRSISGHPKRWAGTSVICLIRRAARDLRTEVGKDLAEIRAKTSELVEKKVAAEDQLKRVDIRAMQLSGCTRSSNEGSKHRVCCLLHIVPHAVQGVACLAGQINVRKIDGWQTLATKPIDQPIDLAS
jgi:hypothetical protein